MGFERKGNNRRVATFEVDPVTQFHEQVVAMSSLGILTSRHRRDPERRIASAQLGVKIASLEMTKDIKNKNTPIPTSLHLSVPEATTLAEALAYFQEDAPATIVAAIASSPYNSNIRAVEAHMASKMLRDIQAEYPTISVDLQQKTVGFA